MEKKFKVVAKGLAMDAKYNCRYKDQANEAFKKFRDSGSYSNVYIVDIGTDEVCRTYDIYPYGGGVRVDQWQKLEW